MSDASEALNTPTEGPEAAMAYLDSLEAAPKDGTPAQEPVEAEEQATEAVTSEVSEDEPVVEEVPAEADPEPTEDAKDSVFQDLPDDIRADLEGLPVETVEKLRPSLMMQADYTRKTQELARQRREVQADTQDAEAFRTLMSDQSFLDLIAEAKRIKEEREHEPFDYANAEPTEIDERVSQVVEQRLAREKAAASEEAGAVDAWAEGIKEPMTTLKGASGLTDEQWLQATDRLAAQLDAAGINPVDHISPDNVEAWIAPHIASVQLDSTKAKQQEAQAKSKSDATRSARASSPAPTRAVAKVDPEPWKSEGRPATRDELRSKTLKEFADLGVDFSQLR